MDVYEKAQKLEDASYYEGSELGEVWRHLSGLVSLQDYMSKELAAAVKKEIEAEYKSLKENFVWKEEPVVQTTHRKWLEAKT